MKNLVACALMPHPPMMVPEIGKENLAKIKATVEAVTAAAGAIKQTNPETVVIITPHGAVFKDAVAVSVHPRLRGSLEQFGAPEVALAFETDGQLIKHIVRHCARLGVNLVEMTDVVAKSYRANLDLDHGALVPLYYLQKAGFKGQIVILSVGMLSYEEMYTFGKAVQSAIESANKKTAVIASGDLSHKLLAEGPYGYDPMGPEFDKQLMLAMKNVDAKELFNMEESLIAGAAECGLRPSFFLLGVMGGLEAKVGVTSYEGPFGVGYGVISYTMDGKKQCCRNLTSSPAALAKASLKYYLTNGQKMNEPKELQPPLNGQAGVFVSLKKNGALRGCIGTFLPQEPTVAQEIIKNAISAATGDPRFAPVEASELPDLDVSVDILSTPEQVDSMDALDAKKYGVIVRHKNKTGLLLPDLEGVDTAEQQVEIAMQKAGISFDKKIDLYRFTVTRYI